MDIVGERLIPLPQTIVWDALNNTAILKACIPGCESIEPIDENEFKVVLMAAIGPVKARFTGKLQQSEINAPHSYCLIFEGNGGAAGFGKGTAKVTLAPEADGTRLSYTARAQIGGKLAQIGARLIDSATKSMANEFFSRFTIEVRDTKATPADAPTTTETIDDVLPAPADKGEPHWFLITAMIISALIYLTIIFHS